MTQKKLKEVEAKVAQKKDVSRLTLPKELKDLVVDTSKLKNKKSSTTILKELRYSVK